MDIFYLHGADRSVPFAETLEEVDKIHQEGKFKRLGLSNNTSFEVAEIITLCTERGLARPTIYQAMYNAISKLSFTSIEFPSRLANREQSARNIETELIPACHRYGLEIVI